MSESFEKACLSVVATHKTRWTFDGEYPYFLEYREHDEYDAVSDPLWSLTCAGDWIEWQHAAREVGKLQFKVCHYEPSRIEDLMPDCLRQLWNGTPLENVDC